jgi:lipoprotein-anchoring transpeptidase ErfK/SrfK
VEAKLYRIPSTVLGMLLVVCTTLLGGSPASTAPPADDFARLLGVQVALDTAGVSPGLVDGLPGRNTTIALTTYQRAKGLRANGELDDATVQALGLDSADATVMYTITEADAAGPFAASIPPDLSEQGALPSLAYVSVGELLAERFHTTTATLARLNPDARFAAGDSLRVPAVGPMTVPEHGRRKAPGPEAERVLSVTVSKAPSQLVVLDADGRLLFSAPVTSGSEHDPLPIGQWTVRDVYLLPVFHYNPDLFWDADPSHARTTIKPGPNNPVGAIWIDLDREHYGLHGTPEPQTVGRSASHGCVRLTNWDALRLAQYVKAGTRVVFDEKTPPIQPWAAAPPPA